MKALVTGASGFIGGHIVDQLLDEGHEVAALVRKTSDTTHLREREVPLVVGDVTAPETLDAACEGMDWVFHTAAVVGNYGSWSHYRDVGVGGTRNMINAASNAGVDRFVHLGSIAVYGTRPRGQAFTEETPYDRKPERWNHYVREKVQSEILLWRAHDEGRIQATSIRPSVVLGPRDLTATPRTLAVLRHPLGSLVGDGANRMPCVVVEELAEASVRAASTDVEVGRAYNLSGAEPITQQEYMDALAEAAGLKPKTRTSPEWMAMGMSTALEGVYRLLGRESEPFVTRLVIAIAGHDYEIDCSRAKEELGWEGSADYVDAIQRSVEWELARHR